MTRAEFIRSILLATAAAAIAIPATASQVSIGMVDHVKLFDKKGNVIFKKMGTFGDGEQQMWPRHLNYSICVLWRDGKCYVGKWAAFLTEIKASCRYLDFPEAPRKLAFGWYSDEHSQHRGFNVVRIDTWA